MRFRKRSAVSSRSPWPRPPIVWFRNFGAIATSCATTVCRAYEGLLERNAQDVHGIGPTDDEREPPIATEDALRNEPHVHADVVLTNPPFGKKSSITVVNEEGDSDRQALTYNRPDFWTTTANKQLNFVQHVKSLLKIHGRAAVVVPNNPLSRHVPGTRRERGIGHGRRSTGLRLVRRGRGLSLLLAHRRAPRMEPEFEQLVACNERQIGVKA